MSDSIVKTNAGRFTSIRIRNSKTNKRICGRFLWETPKTFRIEDINAKTVRNYRKSSVSVA